MPSLQWRLDKLTGVSNAARSELLLSALAQCDPKETELIARSALTSGTAEAVAAVIRLLDRHPPLYADLMALDRQTLAKGMQLVFFSGFGRTVGLAIALARRLHDPQVSIELLAPLRTGDEATRVAAATAVLETTISLVGENGRGSLAKAQFSALDQLICGALDSYVIHRRNEIILAAALLHGCINTKLRAMLAVPGTPQRLAVQGIPRRIDDPLVRWNLINWLKSDLLGRQAAQFLDTLRDPAEFADALAGKVGGAHLLLTPVRRKMLAHANRAARCLPELPDAVTMPESAQQWLPRYVSALPMPATRQVSYLSDLIALPSPTARWRAVEIVMAHRTDAAHAATRYFARDSEPAVAISPAAQLLHDGNRLSVGDLRSLLQCRHSTMAKRAMTSLASRSAALWAETAMELPRSALIATALQLRDSQKSQLAMQLKSMLEADERARCLCGIFVVRRLKLTQEFDGSLLALLQSDDAQRCSAAASALADCQTPQRVDVLKLLLQHDHARVRANAVEAIAVVANGLEPARGAATIVEVIAPHSESRHNRERANALAAWIRHGENKQDRMVSNNHVEVEFDITIAVDRLRDMLRDPDPLHRVSAIWAATRTHRQEVVEELQLMAKNETLEPVRRRAAGALRRLMPAEAEVGA